MVTLKIETNSLTLALQLPNPPVRFGRKLLEPVKAWHPRQFEDWWQVVIGPAESEQLDFHSNLREAADYWLHIFFLKNRTVRSIPKIEKSQSRKGYLLIRQKQISAEFEQLAKSKLQS